MWHPGILLRYLLVSFLLLLLLLWWLILLLLSYPTFFEFYLKIYIFGHFLSGLLLDVVVTRYCHIYYQAHVCFFLFDYYIWCIVRYMSICYYLGIPQYCYLHILCYCNWIVHIPVFCIHIDSIVFACIQMYLESYLIVPVKVLISW